MTLPQPDPAFHWAPEPWGDALRCRPLGTHSQHLFTSKQPALPGEAAWSAALASVGSSPNVLMRVKQVHGNLIRVLARGRVAADAAAQLPDGDAIIANEPGLALAVLVADCVPILVCDPALGAAAAIHAGWRGTCARVVERAVALMASQFGSTPANLTAAIGPSVGPDDYEVGPALIDEFRAAGHGEAHITQWFRRRNGTLHLDLWSANTQQLLNAGVTADRIFRCGLSTVSHPDVFDSYRVAGERAGRMAAIIVVPQP